MFLEIAKRRLADYDVSHLLLPFLLSSSLLPLTLTPSLSLPDLSSPMPKPTMETTNPFHTHRRRVISVLLKGKKSATQLQTLLRNFSLGSQEQSHLVLEIMGSFSEAVSQLKNGLPPPDSALSGGRNSGDNPAKARRGCYNRRF
nr:probable WRKY transcription factor 70 [Ipomoea batatas]GMC63780.1 probable WRKY transcription factor 70 [Ipomoea batatas]